LNIRYNASDGQSISPVAGTPRARAIGGGDSPIGCLRPRPNDHGRNSRPRL
jgi:hypothetical protein